MDLPSKCRQLLRTAVIAAVIAFMGIAYMGVDFELTLKFSQPSILSLDEPQDHPALSSSSSRNDQILTPKLYRNLSCPFEWSKFSCFHQGREAQAEAAHELVANAWKQQRKRTVRDYWKSPYFLQRDDDDSDDSTTGRSNLLLVGDSTMRQVFIALGCRFWQLDQIEEYHLDWKDHWPCNGTPNCITKGNHSGFETGRIRLKDGGPEIFFLPHSGALGGQHDIVDRWMQGWNSTQQQLSFQLNPKENETIYHLQSQRDVVVYNIGLHLGPAKRKDMYGKLNELGQSLLTSTKSPATTSSAPTWVYMTTITQHFQTVDGVYNSEPLKVSALSNSTTNNNCRGSVPKNPRRLDELQVFHEGQNVNVLLDVRDEAMGKYHVGGIDCTHYCMAGPPDLMAMQLLDRLAQHYFGRSKG
ncbi:expressed unknown protein [Seminavis robusta]|uniref:Uncharacterized protein n=1 Tax=Seminavis robusta TaxID=568900 RepID=A0A9N8HBM1_9STRA|nr:expressed unknown protein [Seminavis robusta]|eukprot:Sro188_g081110.1 n/a (413) ;mRNA; r:20197-21435